MEELLSSRPHNHEIYSVFRRIIPANVLKSNFVDFYEDFKEIAKRKYRTNYFFRYIETGETNKEKGKYSDKFLLIEHGFYLYFILKLVGYNLEGASQDINYERLLALRPETEKVDTHAHTMTLVKSFTMYGFLGAMFKTICCCFRSKS